MFLPVAHAHSAHKPHCHRLRGRQKEGRPHGAAGRGRKHGSRASGAEFTLLEIFITQTLHGTAIYAYIGVVWGVNVGIYSIHGVYGLGCQPRFQSTKIPSAFVGDRRVKPPVHIMKPPGASWSDECTDQHGSSKEPLACPTQQLSDKACPSLPRCLLTPTGKYPNAIGSGCARRIRPQSTYQHTTRGRG